MNTTDEVESSLMTSIQDGFENRSITSNGRQSHCDDDCAPLMCPAQDERKSCRHQKSDNPMCLSNSEDFLDSYKFDIAKPKDNFKKTVGELSLYSLKQLQILVEDLTRSVEEVSSELVQLLLENDALQQESDARNIAIEQLLKMTVNTSESDLKPIQMSVVFPNEDCDVI